MTARICSIEGCGKPQLARGWCGAHYQRWQRLGSPLAGGTFAGEPERYFREVVLSFAGDECLIWPYHKVGNGYGALKRNGHHKQVHRLACEARHGPPPTPEHDAAHSCGKGHYGCCNPNHLRWATHTENCADRLTHGTHTRGERNGMAKLSEAEVLEIRALRGAMPQREIAVHFGISASLVGDIHRGGRWAWL